MAEVIKKGKMTMVDFPRLPVISNAEYPLCALKILCAVARYYGMKFSVKQFDYLYNLAMVKPGLSLEYFEEYLLPLGIKVEIKKNSKIEDIRETLDEGKPCAVCFYPMINSHGKTSFGGNHIAVVVGISDKYIYYADSSFCLGQIPDWLEISLFEKMWYGIHGSGFPGSISNPDKKDFGVLVRFDSFREKPPKNYKSIWERDFYLKKHCKKVLKKRWSARKKRRSLKKIEKIKRENEMFLRERYESVGNEFFYKRLKFLEEIAPNDYVSDLPETQSAKILKENISTIKILSSTICDPEDWNEYIDLGCSVISQIEPIDFYRYYISCE